MTRAELLDLVYERCSYFIRQDRYISMEEFLSYVLAQLEREKALNLVTDSVATKNLITKKGQ